ncbi:MAG TPA: ferrous iron transport protein B [bacterium]|nr:ferrous iron transport protein B [bacterium]
MAAEKAVDKKIKIALAGNPNCGKTSLFNALTGTHQRVGNYPGITVEKKEGRYRDGELEVEVIDLPGTYSLSSYSPEERIARRELLRDDIDVVVVVADSTNLERNLYLLVQVMELGANPVLALNMSDEAHGGGQRLDVDLMSMLLGFPIVETVGHKGGGAKLLREAIRRAHAAPTHGERFSFGPQLERTVMRLAEKLAPQLPQPSPPPRWLAVKLLERDDELSQWLREKVSDNAAVFAEVEKEIEELEKFSRTDIILFIADNRYSFISGLLREARISEMRADSRATSDFVDSILCNRIVGLPIFFAAMYVLFWLTFTVGEWPMRWIESFFGYLGEAIGGLWPVGSESPLRSLLVDGVLAGVGGVLVFLPNIILLFFGLALMEDSGYMSRAAFLVDRFMHRFGLHGKSFVPMLTGFGCTVPGIMATRTLENERDRLTTMLVLPLMSCGARLPIYMLLIPAFFASRWQAPMLFLIYMTGIMLAVLLARLLRSTLLAGEDAPFVMELPPYRLPTLRAVAIKMGQRSWSYVRKAGTIILAISILMWVATSFPRAPERSIEREPVLAHEDDVSRDLSYSLAGRMGKLLEPLTTMMGSDYRIATAMLGAFAAKEVFVAQLGIVFSLGEADENSTTLRETLRRHYTPLQAFAMMLFLLVATPCMATVAIMRKESGSWKWALLQFFGLTTIGWLLSVAVYQIGRLVIG